MKKIFLVSLFLFCVKNQGFSQLIEGDLLTSKRKITNDINAIISPSNYDGKIVFDISVNEFGAVTSAKVIDNRTEIISTPARISATKLIYSIKFEPGTHFPKYHNGVYQVIFKKN